MPHRWQYEVHPSAGRPAAPPTDMIPTIRKRNVREERAMSTSNLAPPEGPAGRRPADGGLARLARFCYRRRRLVLLTWIVGVIVVAFAGFGYGAAADNDFSGGNTGSAKAQKLIERHFPEQQGDTLTLAIKAEKGIDDAAARRKIEKVIADLAASPITGPVTLPYQDKNLVTEDRRIARTTVP